MSERAICLAGPTGAGKTQFAIAMARHFNCEIINTDSRQVYADFPIITAQPTLTEQQEINHHLYGFLASSETINAGQWAIQAMNKVKDIQARGKIPLFVGGTGFYFRALLEGLANIPKIPQHISHDIASRISKQGSWEIYKELVKIDPVYASKVHPNDRHRIQRALEVWQATGYPFTWWHQNYPPQPLISAPFLIITVTLKELEPVLAKRIDLMIEQGAIEEAKQANIKYPNLNPGWSGIGCAELRLYIKGEITLEECKKLWLANTRAYAKRQLTWFRAQKNALWINRHNPNAIISFLTRAFWV